MESISIMVIVFAYVSLGIELIFFHVPSVASNISIWKSNELVYDNFSPRFQEYFRLSLPVKLLLFGFPLLVVYAVFFYPIGKLFFWEQLLAQKPFMTKSFPLVLGWFFILLGRCLTFISVLQIRKGNKQRGASFELHRNALFAWSRNPGLLGMLGIWFCMPDIVLLIGICFYIGYMHFKVLMEEDFLRHKFGKDYNTYLQNTMRYFDYRKLTST